MTDNINSHITDLAGMRHTTSAGIFPININTRCPSNYAIIDRQTGKVLARNSSWGKETYVAYGIKSKKALIKILKRSIKIDRRNNRYTKTKEK